MPKVHPEDAVLPGQLPPMSAPPRLPQRRGKVRLVSRPAPDSDDAPMRPVVPGGRVTSTDALTVHRLASLAHLVDGYRTETMAQMRFKQKLLSTHGTSWAHQHYYVFETWTRYHIMITTGILGMLGVLQLSLLWVWMGYSTGVNHNPMEAGLIGYGYIIIAPLCIATACVGGYGAWKIKHDLQQFVHDSAGANHILKMNQDKGQREWKSHKMLLAYFYLAWFCAAFMIIVSVVTFKRGMDDANPAMQSTVSIRDTGDTVSMDVDSDDGTEDFGKQVLVYIMAILGLGMAVLLELSMYSTIKMVSFYDIVQTLLEMINLILLVVSIAMMIFATISLKHFLFLSEKGSNGDSVSGLVFVAFVGIIVYGIGCVFVTFFGFLAAVVESKRMLLFNAFAMAFGCIVGVTVLIIVATAEYESIVRDNCVDMLNLISEDFFKNVIKCAKYQGYGEVWNGTGWEGTTGVGESVQCTTKSDTAYYWEGGGGVAVPGRTEKVNYWGCLSREDTVCAAGSSSLCVASTGCCTAAIAFFDTYDWILITVMALLVLCFVLGGTSAMYIRHYTTVDDEKVLLHPRSKQIFVAMLLLIFAASIFMAFYFNSGDYGSIRMQEQRARLNLNSGYKPTVMPVVEASCTNNKVDGEESDIDCGGSCPSKCELSKGCNTAHGDTDCSENLVCGAVEPASEYCFDGRCLPGQVDHANGRCNPVSTCANGVKDALETCVDGGGPTCTATGGYCSEGGSCVTSEDCSHGLFCAPFDQICFNCTNGAQDGDETDTDCGGQCGPCVPGAICNTAADCASGVCFEGSDPTEDSVCVSCFNDQLDGHETCVDGGGDCPNKCAAPLGCATNSDCLTGHCSASTCIVPLNETCADGIQNGLETCVDGGGSSCGSIGLLCGTGGACGQTSDCAGSGSCYTAAGAANGICFSCSDDSKNGDETSTDCGGSTCAPCNSTDLPAPSCSTSTDCDSGLCFFDVVTSTSSCVSCSNGRMDGNETCSDAGGSCPSKCGIDAGCGSDTDCASLNCDGDFCRPPTIEQRCSNGVHDTHVEAAVDCGGVCSSIGKLCPTGSPCTDTEDCAQLCENGTCISCGDSQQNGEETDKDCGGAACPACKDSFKCVNSTDCASGNCHPGDFGRVCVSCDNGVQDGSEADVDCGACAHHVISI